MASGSNGSGRKQRLAAYRAKKTSAKSRKAAIKANQKAGVPF